MANDAVRRIMAEMKELSSQTPDSLFVAAPLDSDLFEWCFTIRGPPDTAFEGGVYHGRILLPAEYPLKAPEIMLLTPNGRFELNVPICLSVTSHHQETWQPSWGIRTILTALIGFLPSPAEGLGALDFPDSERRKLAIKSHNFTCPRCGAKPTEQLPRPKQAGNVLGSSVDTPELTPSAGPGPAALNGSTTTNGSGSPSVTPTASATTTTTTVQSPRIRTRRRVRRASSQDTALLYATYAILVLIVGILLRRFL